MMIFLLYIFISHASSDNEIVQKITSVLDKYQISYWVDGKEINSDSRIARSITQGIEKCTHFFLIWSESAKKSEHPVGVMAEVNMVNEKLNRKRIKKFVFRLDDTPAPLDWSEKNYHRISLDNCHEKIFDIIREICPDFKNEMIKFEELAKDDFNSQDSDCSLPIVSYCKNYDDVNLYVEQSFETITDMNPKFDIATYILSEIKQNSNKLISIVSDYGGGKSTLCRFCFRMLTTSSEYENIHAILIPLGFLSDDGEMNLQKRIYQFTKDYYKFETSYDEFVRSINSGKIIFLLDAFDEIPNKFDNLNIDDLLKQIEEISKTNTVILTSRYNFLNESQQKVLKNNQNFFKINDLNDSQQTTFLMRLLNNDYEKVEKIKTWIKHKDIEPIAKKPLFLKIIAKRFGELKQLITINKASIFKILTDEWLIHDVERKYPESEQKSIMHDRERISEILSIESNRRNESSITISQIEDVVCKEFENDPADVRFKLQRYYDDAKNSTFLIRNIGHKFSFISKTLREYFVARRIVNIFAPKYDYQFIINEINSIQNCEIYSFVNDIIKNEWLAKPELIKKMNEDGNNDYDAFEEKIQFILNMLQKIQQKKSSLNVSGLLRILNITNNIPLKLDLQNLTISDAELNSINLSNSDLSHTKIINSNLDDADLKNSNLSNSDLKNTSFHKTNLSQAYMRYADVSGAKFSDANLREVKMRDVVGIRTIFEDASMIRADLPNTTFTNADFTNAYLIGSNLLKSNLSECKFYQTILTRADLRGTNLSNSTIDNIDVLDADFTGTNLMKSNIRNTSFENIKMDESDLREAVFHNLNMKQMRLSNCDLTKADFTNCDLTNTDFTDSTFHRTILDNANLCGAKFQGAKIEMTSFQNAKLDENTDFSGIRANEAQLQVLRKLGAKI